MEMDPKFQSGEAVPFYEGKFNVYPGQPGQFGPSGQVGKPVGPVVVDHTTVEIKTEPPRDYIIWSMLSFFYINICCLGLAAFICSVKARDQKIAGNTVGARHHSSTARTLIIIINACLFAVFVIITLILYFQNPEITGDIRRYFLYKL